MNRLVYRVALQHIQARERQQLSELLSFLRALHFLHWTSHWQVRGLSFYADHQLLERLYTAIPAEIDVLAEKLVQVDGVDSVNPIAQMDGMRLWLDRWTSEPNLYQRSLLAEQDLQGLVRQVYEDVKASGSMSLGLDDFLMSLANDHETHLYLLQQRCLSKTAKARQNPSAEGYFFDAPDWREVREFAESTALTNDVAVSKGALSEGEGGRKLQRAVEKTPPTVMEVVEDTPGSGDFSTLSRYLVQTEHPTDRGVPRSVRETPRHPDIK